MHNYSYINWHAMSDKALAEHIGSFIKHHRLLQNKSQSEVASAASISRSTLSLLENGEPVNIATLLQVLRILNLLHVFDAFHIEKVISPLAIVKEAKLQRLRAGRRKKGPTNESEW
ncbi:MAG: helix-turn-helix domain-containing protein [Cryomorphaceae bacterium]|nr:helix-turn-helix domain-containing protein [Cryomorphaceae bacterium]